MLLEYVLIVIGLSLFEVINSVDNAIINSEVLSKMSAKSRRWFLHIRYVRVMQVPSVGAS